MSSKRNKTIDISLEDGKEYLNRCLKGDSFSDFSKINNKIIIGDTFKVMRNLPNGFVDLMIVDPPYNLSKNYNGNIFRKTNKDAYREFTVNWIKASLPLLKENASVYVCCDWESSMVIGEVLTEFFDVKNRITWQREKGRGAKANWKNGMEDIWFATVSDNYTFNLDAVKVRKKVVAPYRVDGKPKDWDETENGNFRNTCPSNFWDDISIPYWSMPENTAHPTQKPEKLLAKLILASSNEEDVVFDPFNGSGSTSVTAKKLKRNFVGIELNEQYCIWAQKRLEMADSDNTIQGYTNGVFWERNSSTIQKREKRIIGKNVESL